MSRGMCRKSTSRPFTSAIHTSGFFSARLGSVHRDHARLCADGDLADFECGTQVRRRHARSNRFVVEKVDPPKNVSHTARPRARLPRTEWARAASCKAPGHRACQVPVFGVEVLVT